jgi:large subunit ribosomal protein L35
LKRPWDGPPGVIRKEKEVVMPKMKSKRGAAKRFTVRSGGGIKRSQAFMRHILTKKSTKRKRHLRGTTEVHHSNKRQVKSMLPYSS